MTVLSEKTTAKERAAIKRRQTIEKGQKQSGNIKGLEHEPTINPLDYQLDLIKALNYYNIAYDDKEKAKWVIEYVGKPFSKALSSVPDYEFHTLGSLVRLKTRDQFLDEKDLEYIESQITKLSSYRVKEKKDESVKPVQAKVSVADRINSAAVQHVAEFDGMLDDYLTGGNLPDFAGYIKSNELSPGIIRVIPKFYETVTNEIRAALNGDTELLEGYSNFTNFKLRKLLKVYESISEVCGLQAKAVKVARKPRVQKEKPATELVKKIIAMKEYEPLGLKSELFTKLINSSEVRVYNTKYRKLMVYRAAEGQKISVKGTSLIGWDTVLSNSKTIRKPEVVLKDLIGLGKREFIKAYRELTSKEQPVTGRLSADCIILKVLS